MSRLEELIQEMCPDGVEFLELGDICSVKARIGWQRLTKSEYLTQGDYYLITGVDITSNNRVNFSSCYYVSKERYDMDENIQLQNGDIILTKDGTIGKVALIEDMDKPAVLNSHLFVVRDQSGCLNNKFLMYVFLSRYFTQFIDKNRTKGTIPGLNQATVTKFKVPLPPLPVQQEIVRILDNFTQLEAQLEAELEARKKQYEYYRDKLLTFDVHNKATNAPPKGHLERFVSVLVPVLRLKRVMYPIMREVRFHGSVRKKFNSMKYMEYHHL